MSAKEWCYMISTTLVAGIGAFVAAGLEDLTWSALAAPHLILGAALAMAIAVANYFKPSPRQ